MCGYEEAHTADRDRITELERELAAALNEEDYQRKRAQGFMSENTELRALVEGKQRQILSALYVNCGATHQDPEVEARVKALRANEGFASDAGCGKQMLVKYAYRCTECGRWFHLHCIEEHFGHHAYQSGRLTTALRNLVDVIVASTKAGPVLASHRIDKAVAEALGVLEEVEKNVSNN